MNDDKVVFAPVVTGTAPYCTKDEDRPCPIHPNGCSKENRMRASKETAAKALEDLDAVSNGIGEENRCRFSKRLLALAAFLEAAKNRLPTEAAIEKDRARKRPQKLQP